MAGTKFAYVRKFELPDPLLPDTYIVLRVDGHSFHRQFNIFCLVFDAQFNFVFL